jgi:hypothetical protein
MERQRFKESNHRSLDLYALKYARGSCAWADLVRFNRVASDYLVLPLVIVSLELIIYKLYII